MALIGSLNFMAPSERLDCILQPDTEGRTLTKLVATLGPSSSSVEALTKLLLAGMSVARFDLSYGSIEYHLEMQRALQAAMSATGIHCAVMIDLMGPEIFVSGRSADDVVELKAGQVVLVTTAPGAHFSRDTIPLSIASFQGCNLKQGTEIFVGQYLFAGSESSSAYLTVTEVSDGEAVLCRVKNDCTLYGLQLTVHLADCPRQGPAIHPLDISALQAWAAAPASLAVDYINISFCRQPQDVAEARAVLNRLGMAQTRIIAKIEDMEGLVNHEAIVAAADGIILSRGNLGVDLPPEKLFLAQKLVLVHANGVGKPVIVARVVDTMAEAPRPTRAEATDVANLVLDGCDGILLGAETFSGRTPALTVRTVLSIARQAELAFNHYSHYESLMTLLGAYSSEPTLIQTEALASSAVRAAAHLKSPLMIAFTSTGRTARIIAKYRPPMPIMTVVVPKPESGKSAQMVATQMLLLRGVLPIIADPTRGSPASPAEAQDRMLEAAIEEAKKQGLCEVGDQVVVSQCPSEFDRGIVKIIQVERISQLKGQVLGSTADFSAYLDD